MRWMDSAPYAVQPVRQGDSPQPVKSNGPEATRIAGLDANSNGSSRGVDFGQAAAYALSTASDLTLDFRANAVNSRILLPFSFEKSRNTLPTRYSFDTPFS